MISSLWNVCTQVGPVHGWAMATAAMVAVGASLIGSLLVVRRLSLLGDAVSHAVLPGIAVAILAGGRPGGPAVLVGAVIAALMTAGLTRLFRVAGGVAEDAGTGVVFTSLFALGVVIVSLSASRIDLDPGCVLYGILELVPFDTVPWLGLEMPRAFLTAAIIVVLLTLGLLLTWKWQVFAAFDPDAARVVGLPVGLLNMALLVATALVIVAGFEAVGAILVVAMLVVPGATAELLTRRLAHVLMVAVGVAVVGAVVGYLLAWRWNTSAAGMMAVVLGAEYLVAAVLAPREGGFARLVSRATYDWRVLCEDHLADLWRAEEAGVAPGSPRRPLAGGLVTAWLLVTGRVVRRPDGPRLTSRGRQEAALIVRSHRLWETWLGKHAELPIDHLHPPAEWVEHHLGADVRRRIEAEVAGQAGRPPSDPHGRTIPEEH